MRSILVCLSVSIVSASTLRGPANKEASKQPRFSALDTSCFRESHSLNACEQALSSDGRSTCVWCDIDEFGGVCLSTNYARNSLAMMGMHCTNYANAVVGTQPPDFNCLRSSLGESTCIESKSKDDSPCVWCSMADGDASGGCFSNKEAIMANGTFGLTCPLSIYLEPAKDIVKKKSPDVNCVKAAWVADDAETACGDSTDKGGEPCIWCQAGDVAGACLSNAEAETVNGQFGLSCPIHNAGLDAEKIEESDLPDVNCFKAAWVAENAETACGESTDKDGNACVWCQTNGDVAGACLSSAEAEMANGQFGLNCPIGNAGLDELLGS
mmetsp:Transcript_45069/g.94504  ORF Transcript_45069/g.94504 Transcript_45069/m.94504 type:complete len:326 (+) Transcript_45069:298-1275(+)|eukprot:CAMPEP_0183717458 /NCGR_PEP_ID=MMETSP0737-20130205/11071_1 /TAXON_ID=385413 /ORGANISM="Thalassiosira miniscula, Strain CCMP1093" /LENGTH=325 /DNA_ID=CAMNT_0025946909 /DNA_START=274 /DNA_END=1251 /DNA_ORIENTATION=-